MAGIAQAVAGNKVMDIQPGRTADGGSGRPASVANTPDTGSGRQMHGAAGIELGGDADGNYVLEAGVVAIEPNGPTRDVAGALRCVTAIWTVVSKDGSLSAHFEHTVARHQQWAGDFDSPVTL